MIATPPEGAAPAVVAQALVDAVNVGDSDLVAELSTSNSPFSSWLDSGASMRDAQLYPPRERADGTAIVDVSFTAHGTDLSLPEGTQVTWSIEFVIVDGEWRANLLGAG